MKQKLTINTQKISIEDVAKVLAVFKGDVKISVSGTEYDLKAFSSILNKESKLVESAQTEIV